MKKGLSTHFLTLLLLLLFVSLLAFGAGCISRSGTKTTYYADTDGDGFGDPDVSVEETSQPEGYVTDNTDCDDTDTAVNPGAAEVCANGVDNDCDGDIDTADFDCAEYEGSSTCNPCHSTIYADFMNSGHPYKLNEVSGVAPTYPYSSVPDPPDGYTWADVTYVIGGFGWKARFIGTDGYIITGATVQYNLADEGWVAYHDGETKPYTCGACHTTGWVEAVEGEGQGGLPGMRGAFAEGGVQCEACHGPGSAHVAAGGGTGVGITVDTDSSACGTCHTRAEDNRVLASGGLIRHHEQYDELLASPHSAKDCVECHDPHKTVVYDSQNSVSSIRKECGVDCHTTMTINSTHLNQDLTCKTCHMPYLVKSAISTEPGGNSPSIGDIRTHLFLINPSATADQFYDDTSDGNTYSNGYITLEYVCLPCHTSQNVTWAVANHEIIHGAH